MIQVLISRYGDRYQDAPGAVVRKTGMNVYRLVLAEGFPKAFVFVETMTPDRVAVVDSVAPSLFDIRTFNTLNGYHPGSDLRVRVYRDGEPDLLATGEFTEDGFSIARNAQELGLLRDGTKKLVRWRGDPDSQVLVQAHGRTVQHPVVERIDNKVLIETLITRTPATPLETNIEIAIVRNLGPIRGR